MLHEIYKKNHFSKYKDGKFLGMEKLEENGEKQIDKKLLKACNNATNKKKTRFNIFNYPKI